MWLLCGGGQLNLYFLCSANIAAKVELRIASFSAALKAVLPMALVSRLRDQR
jgi:hypothetical protein